MDIVRTIVSARARRHTDRAAARTVALVPTMGFLHRGHLSLVSRARELADAVWVSIFVNPTQFGPEEDLDRYPRDLDRDVRLLREEGADVVFVPSVEEMYPRAPVVHVGFSGLEKVLCGAHRPVHFSGVGLVVAKLFNIVDPEVAVFGQKDAQQALLIRRLATDLDFPVRVEVAPTVREHDGLAMSSRNAYLNPAQRLAAPAIHRALERGAEVIGAGERDPGRVSAAMVTALAAEPLLAVEYAECFRAADLVTPATIFEPVLLAIAAHSGATRLIDNLVVTPPTQAED